MDCFRPFVKQHAWFVSFKIFCQIACAEFLAWVLCQIACQHLSNDNTRTYLEPLPDLNMVHTIFALKVTR